MAAGSWVDWNTGDLVTASAFQDIQDSIVFIFANESAANAALTNKVEGTIFYDTTDNLIKAWDGSAWISAESGDITAVNTASNSGLAGGATSGAVSLTLDPSNLSSGVTVDSANDLLILEDVTDGTVYKVTPDNLGIGGGGLVLLSSATASNSAELLFDNFVDTSTYSYYHIVAENIIPATTSTDLYMTFRQGGASGSDLNGTYYGAAWQSSLNTVSSGFDSNFSTANFAQIGDQIQNSAGRAHNGTVEFFPSDGTNNGTYIAANFVHFTSLGTMRSRHRAQYLDSTTAATGARFYMSSGNITSGSIHIYGVKKV